MTNIKKVLIGSSRLSDLAGSEITAIELCEVFKGLNYEVFIASFEIKEPFSSLIKEKFKYFDLSDIKAFNEDTQFDLVWLHHTTTSTRILLDRNVKVKYVIYSSLSFFEPIESPPLSLFSMSMYLVNSEENYEKFVESYPEFRSKVKVLHNSALRNFWNLVKVKHNKNLKRIGIVSNHIPNEIADLTLILKKNDIEFDVIGLSGKPMYITPELLHSYDAIITIGKTVQYCIACQIPVYCYDHFGGYGWITLESFDIARKHNFSGRGGNGKLDSNTIFNDLLSGYSNAYKSASDLANVGKRYFDLEENITDILLNIKDKFILNSTSDTDINILSRFNQVFLSYRNMINNLESLLLNKSSSNKVLTYEASERETKIQELNQIASERETKIQELALEVSIIKSSKFFIFIKLSLMFHNKAKKILFVYKIFLNKLNQLLTRSIYI